MKSSSVRGLRAGSSVKTTGWFGTSRSSAATVPVLRAASTSQAGGRRRRLPLVAAAGDEQEADVARHLRRLDDRDPVRPQRPLDFLLGQPALRRHLEQRRRRPFRRQLAQHLPGEAGIGSGDVTVERGLAGRRRGTFGSAAGPDQDEGEQEEQDGNATELVCHERADYSRGRGRSPGESPAPRRGLTHGFVPTTAL